MCKRQNWKTFLVLFLLFIKRREKKGGCATHTCLWTARESGMTVHDVLAFQTRAQIPLSLFSPQKRTGVCAKKKASCCCCWVVCVVWVSFVGLVFKIWSEMHTSCGKLNRSPPIGRGTLSGPHGVRGVWCSVLECTTACHWEKRRRCGSRGREWGRQI